MFALRFVGGENVPEWSSQHATTARMIAKATAGVTEREVEVLRGDKVAYVMMPDGSTRASSGAKVPERVVCVRDTRPPCFCTPCRDDRR